MWAEHPLGVVLNETVASLNIGPAQPPWFALVE